SSANVDLSEMGIMQTTTNLDNEIFTLKSSNLMEEVVERLGLNDVYMTKRGLKDVELYRQSPMLVQPVDSTMPVAYSFAIQPINGGAFTLTDFRSGALSVDDVSVDGIVGDTVVTPVGRFVIDPAPWGTENIGDIESITYSHAPASAYGAAYAARLKVGMGADKGSIINISISDASIQKAEDILLTLVRVYNERWIQDRNQIAISTSRFINERLGIIERELGNVDSDISSFKSQHLLPNVQAASTMYVSQSAENQNQIFELTNQIAMAEVVRRELSKNSLEEPLPVNPGLAESGIQSQIGEYNDLVLDRNQLIANSSEKNPVVKDMTNRMETMRETIFLSIDNLVSSLTARLRSIQRKEATTTGHLAANPNQEKYLLSVERQQKVKESLYLFLLQKREENELSQAFTAYNTRIIEMPFGSNAPTSPNKMNILLIAFVIGLAIPIGIIVLIEMMNTKVRGRKDLDGLAVPFIGEIPLDAPVKGVGKAVKSEAVKAIVVEEGNLNIINEAFRVVRTNLAFMAWRDSSSHVNV
ncbi:MAG: chromosome partitioning protein ParA, partial [Muribaculaceae bacterium]|nr:chromosome partitioning protein ParA [Muribaculaceae bacterium]